MNFDTFNDKEKDQKTNNTALKRYSVTCAEEHTFRRRKWLKPFRPTYELEWQNQQWLQLDSTTCQQIERMRSEGFSRMVIRNDQCLRRHVEYNNPHEFDVLLELSFDLNIIDDTHKAHSGTDYQNQFTLRRVFWWRNKYGIGEAHFPDSINRSSRYSHNMTNSPTSQSVSSAKAVSLTSLEYITPPNIIDNVKQA